MFRQNHDAEAQPSNTLSSWHSHSYARGSTPSSRVFVDLSSPTKAASPPQRQQAVARSRPRPTAAHKSEDELRLVGDFSTPADAVICPDPQSWNPSSHMAPTPAMKKKKNKPGARDSYKPIDTLTEGRGEPRKPRVITYGKQSRPLPQTIGHVQYSGQRAYLESAGSRNSTTSARVHIPQAPHTDGARGPSPAKRRKTQHVIEIDGDDELQHVSPSHTPRTPASPAHGMQPVGSRSQSQVSVGSGTSFTTIKRSSQLQSEFRATDQRLSQHRKPRRATSAKGRSLHGAFSVDNGTVTSPSKGATHTAYVVSDDEEAPTRPHLFDEFEQGVEGPSQRRAVVTSKHFPNARINESTVEFQEPSTGVRPVRFESTNLRDLFRPPPRETEDVDDSQDELAMSPMHVRAAKSKAVPSKAVQAAKTGVHRNKHTNLDGESGWQLRYARSLDSEMRGPGLRLKRESDKDYGIQQFDTNHNYHRVDSLHLSRVSKIDADDVSRIRFTGGRGQDGNIYTVDLEFADTDEFVRFRDNYAMPHSGLKKFYLHDRMHMQSMLEKALPRNNKVGHTSGINETRHADTSLPASESRLSSEQNTIWHQLRAHAVEHTTSSIRRPIAGIAADETRLRPTRTSARPTRSSAASSVLFDVPVDHQEVEKYSTKHGLGSAWKKPLMYGEGKQRATVHFEDLPRLDEEEFLNDSLIDFYMIYLFKQHQVPSDKVYFFNTYFYTALTTDTGRKPMNYAKVSRWTQKIDIFGYDYIVVPINELTHWYLAIICNVSSIDRRPVIEDFDDETNTTVDQMQSSNPQDMPHQGMSMAENKPYSSVDGLAQPTEEAATNLDSRNEEDANLFEEASQLNLVDPHDSGSRNGNLTADSDSANGLKQDVVGKEPANHRTVAADIENLSAFQKSKKPKKRQYVPPKKDPNQPVIIILDSLRETRSGAVRALKNWILAEGQSRRGMEAIIKENGHYAKATQIPTQSNWSDCGVYLLGYVDKFFKDPDAFKNNLLTGAMSAEKDWPEFHPKQMRNEMRKALLACSRDQETARGRERRAKMESAKMDASPASTGEKDVQHRAQNERPQPAATDGSPTTVAAGEVLIEASEPTILKTPLRKLYSPFKFKPTSVEVSDEIPPPLLPSNGSSISPAPASPTKSGTSTSYMEERHRHRSPEVRIPSKSPGKSRAAQAKASAIQPSIGEIQRSRQQIELYVSAQKPWQNENDSEYAAIASVQTSAALPQDEGTGRSARSSPSTRSEREGSAPNVPIEIAESQDLAPEPNASPNWMQTKSSAKGQLAVGCLSSRHTLRAVPSLEEIDPSSFHANNPKTPQQDKDIFAKSKLDTGSGEELSGDQSPMLMNHLLQRAQETVPDMMEIDSPSADAMDVDTLSRGSEVKETPEPEEGHFLSVNREHTPLLM